MSSKSKKPPAQTATPSATPALTSPLATGSGAYFPGYDEFAGASKETIDALLKANTALADGAERIGREAIVLVRRSWESAAATAAALLNAKSVEDVMALQSNFAKAFLDQAFAGTAKLSELSIEVAGQAFDPLSARLELGMAHLAKAAA